MNCENEDSYKMKIIRRNDKVIMRNVQCMLGIVVFFRNKLYLICVYLFKNVKIYLKYSHRMNIFGKIHWIF